MKSLFCMLLLISNSAFAASGIEDCADKTISLVGNQAALNQGIRVSGLISLDRGEPIRFVNTPLTNGMRCDVTVKVDQNRVQLGITTPFTETFGGRNAILDLTLFSIANRSDRLANTTADSFGPPNTTRPTACNLDKNTIVLRDSIVSHGLVFSSVVSKREAVMVVGDGAILNVQFSDGRHVANCILNAAQ